MIHVRWSDDAPKEWRFLYTAAPMALLSVEYFDGHSNEYAEQFGGLGRESGLICTVEYDADDTGYYDPPRSLMFNKRRLQMQVHEKWLRRV